MTCEIVIMNKQAVVLAADSATTVSQWINGSKEERYFKGTNKVFQLSNRHPIGLMTYGAANINGVPLDIVVKDFREKLGDRSFHSLSEYADEFFAHVEGHRGLFPPEFQKESFIKAASRAGAMHLFLVAPSDDRIKQADEGSDSEKKAAHVDFFARQIAKVDSEDLPGHFKDSDLDEAIAVHKSDIEKEIQTLLKTHDMEAVIDSAQLAELAIKLLFKRYAEYLDRTGIVIAGYGDSDYFPGFREYKCYGVFLEKCLRDPGEDDHIDRDNTGVIKPFAMTAMVDTFQMGFSPDVFEKVREATYECLQSLIKKLDEERGFQVPESDALLDSLVKEHTLAWARPAYETHAWPLRRIVGSLPFEDMAELAETLIMLESLKEKVTRPSESVSGPIDVCIISKADGFIWIKRKHYFDPALNARFMAKQRAIYNS